MTVLAVDTSAVVALLRNEPGWEALATRLYQATARKLSVASGVELSRVVAGRQGHETTLEALDRFLRATAIELHPVDAAQAQWARAAFLRFGKGRHPAGLNFGDCFSYALARSLDAPLLFVGNNFRQTDVQVAEAI